jgi:hypothetical protein
MRKKLVWTVVIGLATLTLAACAPRTTSRALSPDEGAAYAAEVDEIVENMIVGFSENDFAKITRDMTDKRSEDYDSSVRLTADEISGGFGVYQGKTLDHVEDRGGWRVVIYRLVFENEPDVTLEVSFYISDPHLIGGTYWDSE